MIKLWQKYFFKEWIKVFVLFISCFYFLYVFVDYAAHAKNFGQDEVRVIDVASYYLFQFSKRAEILVPIALLLACVKVSLTSSMRNEIVAMACSGISLKKILGPFFIAACLCSFFLYINYQFIQPLSLQSLNLFEEKFFHEKERGETIYPVNQLLLEDNSVLVYQSYHNEEQAFFDAFWIKQPNEIYRIKMLYPHKKIPLGKFVDQIVRTKKGELRRVKSYDQLELKGMKFEEKALFTALTPAHEQSLSDLAKTVITKFAIKDIELNDREAQVMSHFFYKLTLPLVCFLIIFATAPFCLRFGRKHPAFLIYSLSIFGLIGFFTLMHSGLILGEGKVLHPLVATLTIPCCFFAFFGWKFSKL